MFVVRAFVKMRETLLGARDLAKKLEELEKKLTGRLDSHEVAIVHVLQERGIFTGLVQRKRNRSGVNYFGAAWPARGFELAVMKTDMPVTQSA